MQINEIFHTIQGEGVFTGMPATFVRLQGCTVGCPWCDTKYTWKKGGKKMSVQEIVNHCQFERVIITGGEPTLYNLDELIKALKDKQHVVHLETSGQNDFKGQYRPDWVTWSPKSNLAFKASYTVMKAVCEVKFVVDKELTLEQVWDCLKPVFDIHAEYLYWPEIVMMPEGSPPTKESMQKAYEFTHAMHELTTRPVRFSDRLQYRIGVK